MRACDFDPRPAKQEPQIDRNSAEVPPTTDQQSSTTSCPDSARDHISTNVAPKCPASLAREAAAPCACVRVRACACVCARALMACTSSGQLSCVAGARCDATQRLGCGSRGLWRGGRRSSPTTCHGCLSPSRSPNLSPHRPLPAKTTLCEYQRAKQQRCAGRKRRQGALATHA